MLEELSDPDVLEALEWFVRLRDETVSDEQRRAFHAWIDACPQNADAWVRAQALWDRFDVVQPEFEKLRLQRPLARRRDLLVGAAVIVVGSLGIYGYQRSDLFADYTTGIGERRTLSLADGSAVELGSYSALSVNFTEKARQVQLFRGQGFFDVAPDSSRPFIAEASNGTTQALGTRFDLKYVAGQVTVTASEHAVSVRAGARPPVKVEEGWQVSYGDQSEIAEPVQADLAATAAWRQDRIVFQDVPLRRVIVELERYRKGTIMLMDRGLGDTPVTAIFNVAQVDSALQTIADSLSIRLLRVTPYVTIVYPTT